MPQPQNPWVTPSADDAESVLHDTAESADVEAWELVPPPPSQPRVGHTDGLPHRYLSSDEQAVTLWWLGAHGGAGESTLERLLAGSRAAGHAWPVVEHGRPARVVLVARTHASGLEAARRALIEWEAGSVAVDLSGLVLLADAPGRQPRPLKDLADLVAGGAPAVWRVPWIEAWRLGDPLSVADAPRPVRRLLHAVQPTTP